MKVRPLALFSNSRLLYSLLLNTNWRTFKSNHKSPFSVSSFSHLYLLSFTPACIWGREVKDLCWAPDMLAKCGFYSSKSNKSDKVKEGHVSKSCRLGGQPGCRTCGAWRWPCLGQEGPSCCAFILHLASMGNDVFLGITGINTVWLLSPLWRGCFYPGLVPVLGFLASFLQTEQKTSLFLTSSNFFAIRLQQYLSLS